MKQIVHLNDKVTEAGGVEVYLKQLQPLLRDKDYLSRWLGIQREGKYVYLVDAEKPKDSIVCKLSDFLNFICKDSDNEQIIFHVHSLSDPVLLEALFELGPVLRTLHEPRTFCPGQGKFWRTDEVPCTLPYGMHCIWHTYQKRCSNRHPKRLLAAMKNTHYELTTATKRYAAIVANSQWIASQAIESGFPTNKVHVIPYFTEEVQPTQIQKTRNPSILFVGRLTKEKGLHYLIDALAAMQRSNIKPHLDIVGDGHERSVFERQVEHLGLRDSCTFHGWLGRSQIKAIFHRCMVVAFPSIYPEAFGIVGIEAMMHARPVVAFDVGGVQEWLQDGVTGLLVEPKDKDGLAAALTRVCKDYRYASYLGDSGRLSALQSFLPENHLSSLMKLYNQIAV
jgi:glycosyltransferase involved in cell wall biosynthesis